MQPRQRELPRRTLLFRGQLLDALDQIQILLEIFALETWREPPEIIRGKIIRSLDLPSKEAASKRAISREGDVQFARGRQNVILFRIAGPQRIFRLQRRDGMNLVRAADRRGGSF